MSYRLRTFDPLDLEIIDRVYEAACARFEAQLPASRPRDELRESLRKRIMTCAATQMLSSILFTSKYAQASPMIDQRKAAVIGLSTPPPVSCFTGGSQKKVRNKAQGRLRASDEAVFESGVSALVALSVQRLDCIT